MRRIWMRYRALRGAWQLGIGAALVLGIIGIGGGGGGATSDSRKSASTEPIENVLPFAATSSTTRAPELATTTALVTTTTVPPTTTTAPTTTTTAPPSPAPPTTAALTPEPVSSSNVYYANCDDARAHGAAPLHTGDPGYRSGLDRDHDGIACES